MDIWKCTKSIEFGRLAQGNKYDVKATDMVDFISKKELPGKIIITYASFVCDHHPLKTDQNRVRLVVGGNRLVYEDDTESPAASILEIKILLNSIISDAQQGARFMSCDLTSLFLATSMLQPEYTKTHINFFRKI